MAYIEQEKKSPRRLSNPSFGLQFPACLREQGDLKNLPPLPELLGNPFGQCVYCLHGNTVNNLLT